MKTYTIKCNWKDWSSGGTIRTLDTGYKPFLNRYAAEREANARQKADRDTGEYNTAYVVVEIE